MTVAMQLIENPLIELLGRAIGALLGIVFRSVWRSAGVFLWLVAWWWRPLALVAGLAGAAVFCVLCPQVPVAVALIAAYAWATKPRDRRCA